MAQEKHAERRRKRQREYYAQPENRNRKREYDAKPEYRERRRQYMRKNCRSNGDNPAAYARKVAHSVERKHRLVDTAVEPIIARDIFDRDEWLCHLCGEDVDPDLSHPDPLSASLDHIVPLSLGGSHTEDNVACAHLRCNLSKGNRYEVAI